MKLLAIHRDLRPEHRVGDPFVPCTKEAYAVLDDDETLFADLLTSEQLEKVGIVSVWNFKVLVEVFQ